ncbi:hypothetical protein BV20DRAFT_1053672 [Pilatotrama ljubarskyi]|nr:hypothetical protein BV20DRAFT_1053672 [Pilatotrama ljubarskyi]
MSSGSRSESEAAQLAAVYENLFINNCCGIATTVLLVFEYLITLDREVGLFWRRSFTGASSLFLLNRYLPLSVTILEACGFIKMPDRVSLHLGLVNLEFIRVRADEKRLLQSCSVRIFAEQTLYLFQYPLIGRRIALSGRSWSIAIVIFLLALMPLEINIADYPFRHAVNDPIIGCAAYLDQSPTLSESVLFTLNCLHLAFKKASFANDSPVPVSISYVAISTDP